MVGVEVKTQDLTGRALDWAVGVAVGYSPTISGGKVIVGNEDEQGITHMVICEPTTNWGQLGPIIEDALITVTPYTWDDGPGLRGGWCSVKANYGVFGVPDNFIGEKFYAHSYAEAACRAIVAAKLGDQVDVPEVLL